MLSGLGADEKYKVNTLSIDESLQLLSWHAFGVPVPLEDYAELSERIASYTGGLPLDLTIIGSHLHGKSVQEWSYDAEKLRKMPHDDIQKLLKISYDGLDDDTQNIFLDIACFFIGHNKNDTTVILEACGFHAESGIKTLIERCLLTVSGGEEFGRLEMHDLLQDMGREIVRKESPQDPGKRSRLVHPKDVFDVLQGNKGAKAIEGMIVNSDMLKDVPLRTKVFTRMVNLRILILDGVYLRGSFKYLSNKLRLFKLRKCHLSRIESDFRSEKLVKLDFEDTKIKEFQPNMQQFRCLKILNLDGYELKKMPDLSGPQSLQKLAFHYCQNLVHVHPSIGSLERLAELHFEYCKKLKELPSSICKLKSLELLRLGGCEKLKELPIELGKLDQLRELYAWETAISHIPFSLGCLRNLRNLWISRALLPSKSKSQVLDILSPHFLSRKTLWMPNGMHEEPLAFSLCHLSNLKSLYLNRSENLRELVELAPSLVTLSTKNCFSLKKIADLSKLKRLKTLMIHNCKSLTKLPSLESLESLEHLDIRNCNALSIRYNFLYEVDLPTVPGSLASLRELDLIGTLRLPLSLCHHSNLRTLCLDDWRNLKALPQLPSTLEYLSTRNCVSLEKIADISSLKRLEYLYIGNCKNLVELPGLESSLESLWHVEMRNCSGLSIPLIEKWFQAHSKGDNVNISFDIYQFGGETRLECKIPTHFRNGKYFSINCKNIDVDGYSVVCVSVRSKTTGAWILNNAKCSIIEEEMVCI